MTQEIADALARLIGLALAAALYMLYTKLRKN